MNTVFILLMFLVPGLIIKSYQNYMSALNDEHNDKKTIYEQMFEIVAHSIIVTILTVLIINFIDFIRFGVIVVIRISDLLERLDIISFAILYVLICSMVTALWKYCYDKWIMVWLHKRRNKILIKKYGVESKSKDDPTTWEDIFFNPEITENHMFVSVYKDGTYITSGEIRGYNDARNLRRELEIRYTYEIEKVIKRDKDKPDKDKWLHYADFEYFDVETGILIIFYDPKRILEHWDEIEYLL